MPGARVPLIVAWIAVSAGLAGAGALTRDARRRALLLGIAAAALLVLAAPAIFSIGVPLLMCALAVGLGAALAAQQSHLPHRIAFVAPIVLIAAMGAILSLGFALTPR